MDILLVNEFFPDKEQPTIVGGVQARNFFITKYLKKNHNIERLNLSNGPVEATTWSLFPRFVLALKVIATNPKKIPDIIEASNVSTYLPAYILANRLHSAAVAWIPDVIGEQWKEYFSPPVAFIGKLMEQISIKLPWIQIIAMSKATRNKLVKQGITPEKITVIYGGVEYEKLSTLKVKKFSHPTICSIARLLPYKRIGDLIKAIAILKKIIPEIRCLIIGEGPEKENLKSQIVNLKLSTSVNLLGNMPYCSVIETLKKSHLFCLPSIVEGFGIVTVEAMASGVPFVTARIPATEEATQNGMGGFLFDPKNVRELAMKLHLLLTDIKLYQQKKREGLLLAKQYDWAIIAKQTEAVYKKAIRNY